MGLYHKLIGFPPTAEFPNGNVPLTYSRHAMDEARKDRFGDVVGLLPKTLNTTAAEIVEAEIVKRKPVKVVYRQQLDQERDIVMAVCFDVPGSGFVKTVFVNNHNDKHFTLDRRRYADPRKECHRLRRA